jgi:hypothetical protein
MAMNWVKRLWLTAFERRDKLAELLEAARSYKMTPEEREAQRQSWVRGEMGMGNDAQERAERYRHPDRCICGGLYVGGRCCRCAEEYTP